MQTPIIIVNFKTYDSAYGERAVALAKICEKVAKETGHHIAVAVAAPDIYRIANEVSIPVLAQHVDSVKFGSHTGYILPEDVKEEGAVGTLINHSEHRVDIKKLEKYIERAQESHLIVVACAKDSVEAKAIAAMEPDFIAVEPPELIGGDISVSKHDPEIISDTVANVKFVNDKIPVLVGAGVKDAEDVKIALELGAKGILIASGITKSSDPEKALKELVEGIH